MEVFQVLLTRQVGYFGSHLTDILPGMVEIVQFFVDLRKGGLKQTGSDRQVDRIVPCVRQFDGDATAIARMDIGGHHQTQTGVGAPHTQHGDQILGHLDVLQTGGQHNLVGMQQEPVAQTTAGLLKEGGGLALVPIRIGDINIGLSSLKRN